MRGSSHIALCLALVLGGCGGAADAAKQAPDDAPDHKPAESVLVVDGERITGDDERSSEPPKGDEDNPRAAVTNRVLAELAEAADEEPWPAPKLMPDGTIDDGEDPFTDGAMQVQGAPIEDDAATTRDIDAWSVLLRRVDREEWDAWLEADLRSPFLQDDRDPTLGSIVRVSVQRCGGAKMVATGAVVADETVVTTVHAVESAGLRVRVSPALGEPQRIPAMVRYLDVDDDIAVLKVPGLKATPLAIHAPTGTEPGRGFAYGISSGHPGGSVRRAPALVAMAEESINVEQPDGFGRQISDRSVFPMVAAMSGGFASGVVTATSDKRMASGWGLHGLVRARVPYRTDTAGIVVPARLVQEAVSASQALDPWYEHKPGGCPQWYR